MFGTIVIHVQERAHVVPKLELRNRHFSRIPRSPIMRRWTEDDVEALLRMWRAGLPTKIIAMRLHRTARAVRFKATALKASKLIGDRY